MKNSLFSWKRFKGSFVYAWAGLWQLLKKEQNLWIILFIGLAVMLFAWYLGLSLNEKAILVLVITSVMTAEILNTTVEFVFDKFHMDDHKNIKIAKDIMAGFVLIWAIVSVVIGLLIFWPYL